MIPIPHRVISASLSPNTQRDDVFLAFQLLFSPWRWKKGRMITKAEEWFKKKYPVYHVFSTNSGRSALFEILRSFDIGTGDEVLVQAFTCVAVPNSVLWTGAKPVYVDIDSTLNMDFSVAEKKVTPHTRALILQHTFGIPVDVQRARAFAQKHNLFIIEDCAHSLGVTIAGKALGSFSDASFFSFGRDKVLSSVFGGVGIIHSKHERAVEKLKHTYKGLQYPSFFWIFQQLFHPVLFSFVLPLYSSGIGKALLISFQRLKLVSFPVYPEERVSKKPDDFPARFPNVLAALLVNQLKKLPSYSERRSACAGYYQKNLAGTPAVTLISYPSETVFLRFPVLVQNPVKYIAQAKKKGILLGNWYHHCIDPEGVDFSKIGYSLGSCPNAEYYAKHIINLPTRISEKEARLVVRQLLRTK